MWAPANLARLVAWFLALLDSTCRAFVWRCARRLPGDLRAPDALPAWWLGDDETPPVAIVTGAGSGIGRATAKRLHALGARVAVVCATLEEAEATSARIVEEEAAEAGTGTGLMSGAGSRRKRSATPVAFGADLRDGAAIDALVQALDADRRTAADAVRCVVHCAGVMRCSFSRVPRSGLEETAAVNAVAPALLTRALAARGSDAPRSPPLRVVTVGSFTHRAVTAREMRRWIAWVDRTRGSTADGSEPAARRAASVAAETPSRATTRGERASAYVPATAYACSKTAATMFTHALREDGDAYGDANEDEDGDGYVTLKRRADRRRARARRLLCPVLADPGLVDTEINREWPSALRLLYVVAARWLGLLAAPEDAAATVCRACFLPPDAGDHAADEARGGNARAAPYLFGAKGARLAPSRLVADADAREACARALERWAKL